MTDHRHSTGNLRLDDMLGGGLLPGTLTVVAGATGIGKTQLGIQFAGAGSDGEERAGTILDVSARGDSQNHAEYAQRLCNWSLEKTDGDGKIPLEQFFSEEREFGSYLHVFDYRGQRVTRRDLEFDAWRDWQAQLNARLHNAIAFLYGNFVRGCRRVVVDGVEPAERPQESIQLNLFEYVYHQILRKDPEWVARDLFREQYRRHAQQAAESRYDSSRISCLLLYTSHEVMLDDLIARPLDEGDALSNANTLIYMGRTRNQGQLGRGLYVAKHRGSRCHEQIVPFQIETNGLRFQV